MILLKVVPSITTSSAIINVIQKYKSTLEFFAAVFSDLQVPKHESN